MVRVFGVRLILYIDTIFCFIVLETCDFWFSLRIEKRDFIQYTLEKNVSLLIDGIYHIIFIREQRRHF